MLQNNTSNQLAELMQVSADDWAFALPTIRDFSHLAKRETPYVAHTPLPFPAAEWAYINGLDYERDFEPNQNTHLVFPGFKRLQFLSSGWHKKPEDSKTAMSLFSHAARTFFPVAPASERFIKSLTGIVADFASAVDRGQLNVDFRAFGKEYQCDRLASHFDGSQDFTAGLYLKGARTLQVAPNAKSLLEKLADSEIPANTHLGARLRHAPEKTISLWPTTQMHSDPMANGGTRVAIFLFANRNQSNPAL